jgi:8-oxo-dGTP diphosphatase
MNDQNNIHVVSRAVIIDQGHILLCKTLDRTNNFYFLPGGHIEYKESAREAVLRELIEETGALCTIKKFLGNLEHISKSDNKGIHDHEYNFIFEVTSDSLKTTIDIPQLEDHIKLIWMPLEKINEMDFRAELLKKLIPKWLSKENNNFNSVML